MMQRGTLQNILYLTYQPDYVDLIWIDEYRIMVKSHLDALDIISNLERQVRERDSLIKTYQTSFVRQNIRDIEKKEKTNGT